MNDSPYCWKIKRNCPANPVQLAGELTWLAVASLAGVGVAFAPQGLWLVQPLVGIALLAVITTVLCGGRRAADNGRIEVGHRLRDARRLRLAAELRMSLAGVAPA